MALDRPMSAIGPGRTGPGGLAILRFGFGLALLAAPDRILLACGGEDDERARVVARILGVRHLIEAGVLVRYETAPVAYGGAAVDGIHAATALAFGAVDR